MDFESKYFEGLDQLIAERNRLQSDKSDRDRKERVIREFYNGRPTKTEEEVAESGEDVTNHLMGYARIQAVETALRSIITGKTTFIEITVDTDNPEIDLKTGVVLTQKLNQAIQHSINFFNLFQSIAGELPLTGRAALMQKSQSSWCPRLVRGLLLPEDTVPNSCEIPYAFAPRKLTQAMLKRMENGNGRLIDTAAVKRLIKWSEEKTPAKKINQVTAAFGTTARDGEGTVDEESGEAGVRSSVSVDAWEYFEVRHSAKGYRVSSTIFVEGVPADVEEGKSTKEHKQPGIVIAHDPNAYPTPEAWLTLMLLDSEIGGVKTWDSARGIAELCYPNDADVETLVNAGVEGAILRSRPRFTAESGAIDTLRQWDFRNESVVPEGTKEFKLAGDSGEIAQHVGLLTQNSASLSASNASNGPQGGALRVQAIRQGQQDGASTLARLDCVCRYLLPLCNEMVRRFLVAPTKPGAEGYEDVAWFRYQLDLAKINKKAREFLGQQVYGRFSHIKVKVVRSVGQGDVGSQREVAELLMKNIGSFAPQVRPLILQLWTALITNDQDFAERLVTLPNLVVSAGRVNAENECDTVWRRAAAGVSMPIGQDDIDQDHCESHLIDLGSALARNSIQPWTRLDALGFAGLAVHTSMHVQNLMATADGIADGKHFAQLLQNVVAQAQPIIDAIEEQAATAQAGAQMTPETLQLALKREELVLKARELGLKERREDNIEADRARKHSLNARKQFSDENQNVEDNRLKEKAIDKKPATSTK